MDKLFDRGVYKAFKYCEYCGKIMTMRKKWKTNFDSVKYCSQKCKIESRRLRNNRSDSDINNSNNNNYGSINT